MSREAVEADRRDVVPRTTGPAKQVGPTSLESRAEPEHATRPLDLVDIASMDSFPCSDPPGYYPIHI